MASEKCPLCNEIFFLEVDDDSSSSKSPDCACGVDWNDLKRTQRALASALEASSEAPYESQLRLDVANVFQDPVKGINAEAQLGCLVAALSNRGHHVLEHTSPAVCVDAPGAQLQVSLKHAFITCMPPKGDKDQTPRIVDPAFREQFVIASPSPRYRFILESLPETFVGTLHSLKLVIDILAIEITASFNFQMMPTPPWRRVRALYSKWFPLFQKPMSSIQSPLPAQPVARFVLSDADFDRAAQAA